MLHQYNQLPSHLKLDDLVRCESLLLVPRLHQYKPTTQPLKPLISPAQSPVLSTRFTSINQLPSHLKHCVTEYRVCSSDKNSFTSITNYPAIETGQYAAPDPDASPIISFTSINQLPSHLKPVGALGEYSRVSIGKRLHQYKPNYPAIETANRQCYYDGSK